MEDQLEICYQRTGGYMQHHPWPISEYIEGEELRNIGYNSIPEMRKFQNLYPDT